eukprot:9367138-Lingulodinium_polyedra.AAC.1
MMSPEQLAVHPAKRARADRLVAPSQPPTKELAARAPTAARRPSPTKRPPKNWMACWRLCRRGRRRRGA